MSGTFGPFRKVKKYASPSAASVLSDGPDATVAGDATTLGAEVRAAYGFMPLASATVTWVHASDGTSETAAIAAYQPVMVQFKTITADQDILVGWR